jgi:hypothetical protein
MPAHRRATAPIPWAPCRRRECLSLRGCRAATGHAFGLPLPGGGANRDDDALIMLASLDASETCRILHMTVSTSGATAEIVLLDYPSLGDPAGGTLRPIDRALALPTRAAKGKRARGAARSRRELRDRGEDGEHATLPEASTSACSSARWGARAMQPGCCCFRPPERSAALDAAPGVGPPPPPLSSAQRRPQGGPFAAAGGPGLTGGDRRGAPAQAPAPRERHRVDVTGADNPSATMV